MVDIMAIGAHPDDIEFGCGGILAKAHSQGRTIVMVDLSLGEKGTNGTPEIRKKEAQEAASILGAERIFLSFSDCEIYDTYEGRLEFVRIYREYQPRLILAPMWKGEQNHPDHLACGQMARHACRYARFNKILPHIPIYKPGAILHYLAPAYDQADFLMDVSDHVDLWMRMMNCHKSQLQTLPYPDWVLRGAAKLGVLINKPYAQGLKSGNPLIIEDIMSLSMATQEI